MKLYVSYQVEGGQDEWVPVHADSSLDEIRPAFVTVLACDKLLSRTSPKEMVDTAKYLGPMYFDLDSKDSIETAINDGKVLVNKLKAQGLAEDDLEVYLSGKKGLHILIPALVFMEKLSPVAKLPAIYKEIAFRFGTQSTDYAVYSGRSGRMFRTCYRQRENNNYRVRINSGELDALTADSYNLLCSKPTRTWVSKPAYKASFAILYEGIQQKVASLKKTKSKPVDAGTLRRHLPTIQRVMRGERLKEGVGFNKIAIQLGIYAHEAKLQIDQLIAQCQGLIANHSGDGYRYNTANKREAEIRRMYDYLDDSSGYDYALAPFQSLLAAEDAFPEEDGAEPTFTYEESFTGDSTAITARGTNYVVDTEQGEKHIMDGIFTDVTELVDIELGTLVVISAMLKTTTRTVEIKLERTDMVSSASLHRAVSQFGVSFTGTDIHARYIFAKMLKEVKENGKTVYVTQREGLDLIKLPTCDVADARTPFVVWSDRYGVKIPQGLKDQGVDIRFVGFPSQEGVMKTDLAHAAGWPEWSAKEENKIRMKDALTGMVNCQEPASLAKLVGWMTAALFSQLFRGAYNKFPLLHINGAAGSGKSEMTECLMHLFYVNADPPVLSPASSVFAITSAVAGSASIPVVVDEYKPTEMGPTVHGALKSLFRSSYNGHTISKGGGNRSKESFGALNQVLVSGPIVFISESIEQETALLERCIVLTLRRPNGRASHRLYSNFIKMQDNKDVLSVVGGLIAASIVNNYSVEKLKAEFDPIHFAARQRFGLVSREEISEDVEMEMKIGKPRVVYAHAVAQFGLQKFREALHYMFKEGSGIM